MKLAFVIEHFDPSRGGGERVAGWLALEMARRGHEVHVLCHDVAARVSRYRQATLRASFDAHRSRRSMGPGAVTGGAGGVAGEGTHDRVHVHRLKGMRLHSALGFRLFGRRARAWCRRREFDAVHSFTVACPGDIYHGQAGVFAAMQAQAAAMRAGAGSAWKRILQRLPGKQQTLLALEKRAVRRSGRVISSCAMMTEQLAAYYGAEGRRVVTVVTPGLEVADGGGLGDKETRGQGDVGEDREWFRAHYKLGEADRVALFVGHDFRRKGLRAAIEAVARTGDWKLVVVGLGKVREYVELAGELGLMPAADAERNEGEEVRAARVLFVGPTREMGVIYGAADALLLPTFYEPSGVVALEALGHGLPVVSSALLGIADLVVAHRAGVIAADPRDVAALAAGLTGLPGAGTAEGRALAERARAAAASVTAAGFGDRMEALYREVVRERGR